MPHTVQYRPRLIDQLISTNRIASYSKVFSTCSDVELVGAYLWNSHVCAAFYPLLGSAEVTLRNSIDAALTAGLGKFWWKKGVLQYKSFTSCTSQAPYPVDHLASNFQSAFKSAKREKAKRLAGSGAPEHHEVVSLTEFSTWEFILEHEYMGNSLIWPKYLGQVFRGRWPVRSAAGMLLQCKNRVSLVRNFRNRVFHHEPAWKRYGVTDEHQAVAHLHEKIGKITELIAWVSPEKLDLLEKTGVIRAAYRACSIAEIKRFKHQSTVSTVNTLSSLLELAHKVSDGNEVARIRVCDNLKATYCLHPI